MQQHFQWDDPTIRDLIETLYNKILFDQGLRGKFYETDMRRLKCHQKQFIAFLLDLPDISTCHEKISKIHKHLKITEEQFNRFIALVQQICQHMDIPEDAITQLTSKLETFKPYLVIQQQ